jgi:hypothetical protein
MRPNRQTRGRKLKMNKSIVCTYPDFRSLPKGLKQLLVISENLFFEEAQTTWLKIEDHEAGNSRLWQPAQKRFHAYDRAAA